MGWHFRRSIGNKFFKVNLSNGGVSTTVGIPGLHVNLPVTTGRRPSWTTSLPGTGLYYRERIGSRPRRRQSASVSTDGSAAAGGSGWVGLLVLIAIVWAVIHLVGL